jgi:hypothetical protein
VLTEKQTEVLQQYSMDGHKLFIFGEAAENIPGWLDRVREEAGTIYCANEEYKPKAIENFIKTFEKAYENIWTVSTDNPSVGLQTHALENGRAIHLINYNYNKELDKVEIIDRLNVKVNTDNHIQGINIHTLKDSSVKYDFKLENGVLSIDLYEVPLYTVVEIRR